MVIVLGLAACSGALTPSRPAISSAGGASRVVTHEFDALLERLPEILRPLDLSVLIVERPAPGWAQIELLDFRGRPVGLRLHQLAPGEDGRPRVEARCSGGRFREQRLELAVLSAIEASGR